MARKVEGALGLGLGGMILFAFLAAGAVFFPEIARYIKMKRLSSTLGS